MVLDRGKMPRSVDLHLAGLTAVVTGGSAGIGSAIVRTLAAEGCNVEFCARDQARIDAMLASLEGLPGRIRARSVDVTDAEVFSSWLASIGQLDIFVPNVSALVADWSACIETDIRSTVACTEAAVPFLQKSNHAAITYIGSKAASLAQPGAPAYGASKAAMAHYMKSLSKRLLPGIRVNVVSPGDTWFPGDFWERVRTQSPEKFDRVVRLNPMAVSPRRRRWREWWRSSPARPRALSLERIGMSMGARSITFLVSFNQEANRVEFCGSGK